MRIRIGCLSEICAALMRIGKYIRMAIPNQHQHQHHHHHKKLASEMTQEWWSFLLSLCLIGQQQILILWTNPWLVPTWTKITSCHLHCCSIYNAWPVLWVQLVPSGVTWRSRVCQRRLRSPLWAWGYLEDWRRCPTRSRGGYFALSPGSLFINGQTDSCREFALW